MVNENNLSHKLYYALVDILKYAPEFIPVEHKALCRALNILDDELKSVEEKPRMKLTEREKLVPLCNEFASLSKEDRETVLTRLHGLHEYYIRLDNDIKKEKENKNKFLRPANHFRFIRVQFSCA